MDVPDQTKIINPETEREITINGKVYIKLIEKGYVPVYCRDRLKLINNNIIVDFGKYKDEPISYLLEDEKYCKWLVSRLHNINTQINLSNELIKIGYTLTRNTDESVSVKTRRLTTGSIKDHQPRQHKTNDEPQNINIKSDTVNNSPQISYVDNSSLNEYQEPMNVVQTSSAYT